jgi:ABC-type multidrug transport system ATPase subunit
MSDVALNLSIALRFVNVVKRIGSRTIIAAASFEVRRGTATALVGPNGSGKSTLIAIAAGFMAPTSGRVERHIVGHVGVLPDANLLGTTDTVVSLLSHLSRLTSPTISMREVERVVGSLGLFDVRHTQCRNLSAGLRKRVLLAQALLGDPGLLLLDEPTAGLDPAAAREVTELVIEATRGRTAFVATNDSALVEVCGEAIVIDRGRAQCVQNDNSVVARQHERPRHDANCGLAYLGYPAGEVGTK